jgi:hypothetical protein
MNKDYTNFKKVMLIVGIILLILGIVFLIYGSINLGGIFDEPTTLEELESEANQGFGAMMFLAGGGFSIVIGIGLIYISQIRRVASYVATEANPGITTASHAFGKGLKESGYGKSETKEVVKIKCPHCGYLESEDAEFCSKCGKRI